MNNQEITQAIDEALQLRPGWDGYEAEVPNKLSAVRAKRIVKSLSAGLRPTGISPCCHVREHGRSACCRHGGDGRSRSRRRWELHDRSDRRGTSGRMNFDGDPLFYFISTS